MSLESDINNILTTQGVERVEFGDSSTRVEVMYESRPFFSDWPHGDSEGSKAEQEEYFQNKLGVNWSLVEMTSARSRGGADSQMAVFKR